MADPLRPERKNRRAILKDTEALLAVIDGYLEERPADMVTPSAQIARSYPSAVTATLPTGAIHIWDASLLSYADGFTLTFANPWTDTGSSPANLDTGLNGSTLYPTFYKTTTANLINGHPAVLYDGSHAILTTAAITQAQPMTFAMILKPSEAISTNGYNLIQSLTNPNWGCLAETNLFQEYAGTFLSGGTYDLNSHLCVWVFNGASSQVVLDGVASSGNAGTNGISAEPLIIGNSNAGSPSNIYKGLIGFVAMWGRAFSAGDLSSMHGYAQTNWGTP